MLIRLCLAWCLAIAWPAAAQGSLEVRFYPGGGVYPYPLESARNLNGVLIQNTAILNRGAVPVTLTGVEFQLLEGDGVSDIRRLAVRDLTRSAASGSRMQAAGMLQQLSFQFGGEELFGKSPKLAKDTTLGPGESILIGHQFMSYRGKRGELRVVVQAKAGEALIEASGRLAIKESGKVAYRFPLEGTWFIGAAPTTHSHHRWVVAQEFALDIARVGEGNRSFKGGGGKRADYLAYGANVLAAADGTVRLMQSGLVESDEDLRLPGEDQLAYLNRAGQSQQKRLEQGIGAISGNFVMIEHARDGQASEYSLYAHLQTHSSKVKVGDKVKAGDVIGLLGTSGNSTEPHLHFHVCDAPDPLKCAGIPVQFSNIEIPYADGLRALHTGDIVKTIGK